MKKFAIVSVALLAMLTLSGCFEAEEGADAKDKATVNAQQSQYAKAQPVPMFDYSLERDVYVQLYKARNNNVATHTVWRSDLGKVLGDCASIGYPIPYDSSLTNPVKTVRGHQSLATIEQAEPNGLYASKNSIATWIRCVVDVDGVATTVPLYIEDKVTGYPYPVEIDYDTDRVRQAGAPTVTLTSE